MLNDVAQSSRDKKNTCITTETLRVSTSWIRLKNISRVDNMIPNILILLRLLMHLFSCRRKLAEMQRRTMLQRKRRLLAFRKSQRENFVIGLTLLTSFPDGRSGRIWEVPKSTDWWETIVSNWNQSQWLENFRMKKRTFEVRITKSLLIKFLGTSHKCL